jgi:hypothetical protein
MAQAVMAEDTYPVLLRVTQTVLVGVTHTVLVGVTQTVLVGVTHTVLVGVTQTVLVGVTHTVLVEDTYPVLVGVAQTVLVGESLTLLVEKGPVLNNVLRKLETGQDQMTFSRVQMRNVPSLLIRNRPLQLDVQGQTSVHWIMPLIKSSNATRWRSYATATL